MVMRRGHQEPDPFLSKRRFLSKRHVLVSSPQTQTLYDPRGPHGRPPWRHEYFVRGHSWLQCTKYRLSCVTSFITLSSHSLPIIVSPLSSSPIQGTPPRLAIPPRRPVRRTSRTHDLHSVPASSAWPLASVPLCSRTRSSQLAVESQSSSPSQSQSQLPVPVQSSPGCR